MGRKPSGQLANTPSDSLVAPGALPAEVSVLGDSLTGMYAWMLRENPAHKGVSHQNRPNGDGLCAYCGTITRSRVAGPLSYTGCLGDRVRKEIIEAVELDSVEGQLTSFGGGVGAVRVLLRAERIKYKLSLEAGWV